MINSTSRLAGPFTGNGVTTIFPFTFVLFAASDALVQQSDTSGNVTTLSYPSQYTVALNANQNTNPGGTVTLLSALTSGYKLVIASQEPALQTTDLTNAGNFYPTTVNNALDYITILIQQLQNQLNGTLQIPLVSQNNVSTVIPGAVAGNLIGWNASANALINIPASTGTSLVNLAAPSGAALIGYQQLGPNGGAVTVAAQLDRLSYSSQVTMLQNSSGSWVVFDNYGNLINTSASTTNGLQEAINYHANNGLKLYVKGGATSRSIDYALITCTTGIVWPAERCTEIILEGVHITFSPAVTGVGMSFNSLMEVKFKFVGEIVYQGNAAAVLFKPTTALPVDTSTVCTDSEVFIGSVAVIGGTPSACVQLDPSVASIIGMKFTFLELNGSGAVGSPSLASFGLEILNPGASTACTNNIFDIADIHQVTSSGIQEGVNSTNATRIANNIYRVGRIVPLGGAAVSGFNSFGKASLARIGSISPFSSTIQYGVLLQSGTTGHQIQVGSISGFSSASRSDLGTLNTISHDGAFYSGRRSFQLVGVAYNPITNAAGVTLTAALLLNQVISHTGAVAVTDTTDTAANMVAAMPWAFGGMYFDVKIMNFNSGTLTIAAGVGFTAVGTLTIAAGATRDFRVVIDNVTAPACHIYG